MSVVRLAKDLHGDHAGARSQDAVPRGIIIFDAGHHIRIDILLQLKSRGYDDCTKR
jgi:hypothetical protein